MSFWQNETDVEKMLLISTARLFKVKHKNWISTYFFNHVRKNGSALICLKQFFFLKKTSDQFKAKQL